jgi:hypothetical protein
MYITGHPGVTGVVKITGIGSGNFNIYADNVPIHTFTDHLVPGRIAEWASTLSAISTRAYVLRNTWVDIKKQHADHSDRYARQHLAELSADGRGFVARAHPRWTDGR